jgi:carbamoylphosphate synthase small subunit
MNFIMNRKIYVIGGSNGYANWMNGTITRSMEEADVVVLTGGADINPALYGHPVSKRTWFSDGRDIQEVEEYEKAKILGKKIVGTCRGMQILTALNGGWLIQDMNHYGRHTIRLYDNTTVEVNSLHHQMCYPFDIPGAKVLGWCERGTSNSYLDGNDKEIELPADFVEPEIIWFNKDEMGWQYHPEMMSTGSPGLVKTQQIFEDFLNERL